MANAAELDTYPDGITTADHIAHDMRVGRFPERSSIATFLAERTAELDEAAVERAAIAMYVANLLDHIAGIPVLPWPEAEPWFKRMARAALTAIAAGQDAAGVREATIEEIAKAVEGLRLTSTTAGPEFARGVRRGLQMAGRVVRTLSASAAEQEVGR